MSDSGTIHAAIRARFPAYRTGLLDAASAQELRDHLRACAGCRTAFEPFAELASEEADGRLGHIPLALLAGWDAAAARLPGAERTLLEAHLSGCTACTEGVEFSRRMRAVPRRVGWGRRLGFAAGGAAALVATLLVMMRDTPMRRAFDREAPPAQVQAPAAPGPAVAPPSTPTRPQRRAAIVQLGNATRGGAPQVVRVPAGTTALPLRVPPLLGVGPAARIRIDVRGPGGAAFGHASLEHRALFGEAPPPAIEARAPDGEPLIAGHYDVSAVSDAPDPALPGSFEHADYGFELQLLVDPSTP